MSRQKQIQEYESKRLIDELSKMPPMVIATAYLHAINYTLFGEDVTKAWVTATQQACALEKARNKGYYDALQEQTEYVDYVLDKIRYEILEYIDDLDIAYEICGVFDKYKAESEDKE